MTLGTAAIATLVAGLSVSGVTIKNITNIPKAVKRADCPILFPDPDEWMMGTESVDTPGEFVGQAGVYDAIRRFKYIFLYDVATAGNTMADNYSGMAGKVDLLYSAIAGISMTSGSVTVRKIAVSRFGELQLQLPDGSMNRNVFHGCFFEIDIQELSSS